MRWNEWFDGIDLEQPYGNLPMVERECPYQSDLSESVNECPYQFEWIRWEMNEVKWIEVNRGKMSDLMDLMRSTLWKSPYGR